MIHAYATLLLLIGALVTAFLYLQGEYVTSARGTRTYFLPLTMALILLIALIVPTPVSSFYKAALALGLILSLLGSALSLLPGMPMVVNKAHLLIVLILYMTAFAALHALKWPTPWVLVLLAGAGLVGWLVAPKLAELRISVALYGVILFLMIWQALEVMVVIRQPWTWFLFSGAFCLALADIFQVIDRFYQQLTITNLLVFGFLLFGQLLLALSIWGPGLANAFA